MSPVKNPKARTSVPPEAAKELASAASSPAGVARTPLEAIRALRRIRDRLGDDDPDARWFREVLASYEMLAESGLPLDAAFGLAAPGRRAWFNMQRLENRDDAIRELAKMGMSAGQIAEEILGRLRPVRGRRPGVSPKDALLDFICSEELIRKLGLPPVSSKQLDRIILNSPNNSRT